VNLTTENILLIGSILLLISILAGKTSYKFGVPTLLLFLLIGMLAGSEGVGNIYFNDPGIAQFIGIVSLNFILFSGGLDTSWKSVRPVLWQGFSLATLGVFITAISLGVFIWAVSDFSLVEGLLLGAVVSSTDAAAVFSILRSKNLQLKDNLRPTLEMESGSNDPMAYVLTISFLGLLMNPDQSWLNLIFTFIQQMVLGGVLGFAFAKFSKYAINRIRLDFEGLYPVLVIALMFITFSVTDFFGGNGFLAVYISAVYLGNQDIIHKNTILKMFDGLAWLMQIVLFLTLGLLVFPSEIAPLLWLGILASLFLIFIARPLAVFLSLLPFKMDIKRRWYISWVGLRGAVPIVFATYPLIAGVEKANAIFNIVFFISVSSVLIQGTTLSQFAAWLSMSLGDKKQKKSIPNPDEIRGVALPNLEEFTVGIASKAVSKRLVDLHFPPDAQVVLIKRNDLFIVPDGQTVIKAGDVLSILAGDHLKEIEKCLYDSAL
jgi:potassium/hydrogen antiporter